MAQNIAPKNQVDSMNHLTHANVSITAANWVQEKEYSSSPTPRWDILFLSSHYLDDSDAAGQRRR